MDLAKEILEYTKLKDRPSRFQIRLQGSDYNGRPMDALRISAPVEEGKLVWKVMYFDNLARPMELTKWETIVYDADNLMGAAAFIDGFARSGRGRGGNPLFQLSTFKEELEEEEAEGYIRSLAEWRVEGTDPFEGRIRFICGILKASILK